MFTWPKRRQFFALSVNEIPEDLNKLYMATGQLVCVCDEDGEEEEDDDN